MYFPVKTNVGSSRPAETQTLFLSSYVRKGRDADDSGKGDDDGPEVSLLSIAHPW